MKELTITLISIIALGSVGALAQKPYMKYGQIEQHELNMTVYAPDSTAEAVVLGDYGSASFKYNVSRGWIISFSRHRRIKILNKNGYDYANFAIPYYAPEGKDSEKILAIKATTYNQKEGKLTKDVMTKDAIFDERINKYWKQRKFTLPNVDEGSIIEFSYIIETQYAQYLREWEFQSAIPVVWSEYRLVIPQFFKYKPFFQGYHPLDINESETKREVFKLTYAQDGSESLESISQKMRYVARNVPAFREEPLMTSTKDYITQIKFELSMIQYPGQRVKNYLGTWAAMNKTFLDDSHFGEQVEKSPFLNTEVASITQGIEDPWQKAASIYNNIKSRMGWNGNNSKWITNSLKKAYDLKKGSSADINLLLTSMLQKAGLDADPVLLSTRSNGFVRIASPNSRQFNYVVCRLTIDNKSMLLDATDPYLAMDLLPEKCLNGQGWAVSRNNSGWVNLTTTKRRVSKVNATLNLADDGSLNGSVKKIYDGYEAKPKRLDWFLNGEEAYAKTLKSARSWEIHNLELEGFKNLAAPITENINVSISSETGDLGDVYYLNPMLFLKEEKNPFNSNKREFPVDFACSREKTFYISLTIPEGYSFEEVPVNTGFILPNQAAKFQYNVTIVGNQVNILSRLFINKPLFSQLEYGNLKEFYTQIVAKHAETLVIKKNP